MNEVDKIIVAQIKDRYSKLIKPDIYSSYLNKDYKVLYDDLYQLIQIINIYLK